ncbi:5-formyltetrahydrofolate cyclo-ligase, partial [Micrococcus luteus]|nr:5-formyltetrahydrofolate cyclo-ligase [Micrococcus luteus]
MPEPATTGPVAGVDDVVDAKAALRARLRAARRDRSPARRAAESAAAVEHLWA